MGITIHFRGRVNPKIRTKEFYIYAALISREFGWMISDLESRENNVAYFEIHPHEFCEPMIFNITPEGFFSDHCKTQFAPIDVHKKMISLFEQVKKKLSEFLIQDEGGYWETRDEKHLERQITNCFLAIRDEMDKDPEYYGPVKTEDGRIVDLTK